MSERFKNVLLAITATLVSYLFLELAVWRPNLMRVPLDIRQQLGFLDLLAQPSKRATLPDSGYVAIIGDSYAEGLGDWLMRSIHDGNPDISAGDVLHRISGRDVLSFGFRGGHPAQTYTFETTAALEGINRYAGLHLPEAGDVIAYFYEGNDVSDLMAMLRFSRPDWAADQDIASQAAARRWVAESGRNGHERAYKRWHVFANAHLADTAGHLVKLAIKNQVRTKGPLLAAEDPMFSGRGAYSEDWSRYNQSKYFVRAGGKRVAYPSPTVEPFLFHDRQELDVAGIYFAESLAYLKSQFPGARLWVAYIPSPINVYPLAQPTITLQDRIRDQPGTEAPGPVVEVAAEALALVSNATCDVMAEAAKAQGVEFIDTRPGLRDSARSLGYLHGPNDPGHLNRHGYESLAGLLKAALEAGKGGGCQPLPVRPGG
ncbi:MAG: hypothetical protein HY055_10760 [Magnetospirillum sp.]|nr:hypothetical protein [Magnetospirillum sp.]